MAKQVLRRRRRPGRRLLAAGLAASIFSTLSTPASGVSLPVDVSASPNGLIIGETTTLQVKWTIDLGPSRFLLVTSPRAIFETRAGRPLGTAGTRLERADATGIVTLSDLVRVPARIVAEALRLRVRAVVMRRQFTITGTTGPGVRATGDAVLALLRPRIDIELGSAPGPVPFCDSRTLRIPWRLVLSDVGPIDVESRAGRLEIRDTSEPPLRLPAVSFRPGASSGALETEILELPAALPERAVELGAAELLYRRTFEARAAGGFARSVPRSFAIAIEPPTFDVAGAATPSGLALGGAAAVTVTWTLTAPPCLDIALAGGRFETAQREFLGAAPAGRATFSGTAINETLTVPAEIIALAAERGSPQVALVREFSDPLFAVERSGRATFDVTGTAIFDISRIALSFAGGEPFRLVSRESPLRALARINYSGSGLLQARWRIADPTSTLGSPVFRPIGIITQSLPGDGLATFISSDLPTDLDGTYVVTLAIDRPTPAFEAPEISYEVGVAAPPPDPDTGADRESPWRPPPGLELPSSLPEVPPDFWPTVPAASTHVEREVIILSAGMDEAVELDRLELDVKMRFTLSALVDQRSGQPLVSTLLRVPPGSTVAGVVRALRDRFPDMWVDANHFYTVQGTSEKECALPDLARVVAEISWGSRLRACDARLKVGLVDAPVDPSLVPVDPERTRDIAFTSQARNPRQHGTALAGLLIGTRDNDVEGLIPEARDHLYVAQVLHPRPGRDDAIRDGVDAWRFFQAIAWLSKHGVDVMVFGFAGPRNLAFRLVLDTLPDTVSVTAPFGEDNPPGRTYPADHRRVVGVIALDVDRQPFFTVPRVGGRLPVATFGTRLWPRTADQLCCKGSCAAAILAAALWVSKTPELGLDRGALLDLISEPGPRWRRLKPLSCRHGSPEPSP